MAAQDRESRLVRPATSATLWDIPRSGFCSTCSSLGTPHYSSWLTPLLPILESQGPQNGTSRHGCSASHSHPFNSSSLASFPGSGQRQARPDACSSPRHGRRHGDSSETACEAPVTILTVPVTGEAGVKPRSELVLCIPATCPVCSAAECQHPGEGLKRLPSFYEHLAQWSLHTSLN